MKSYSSSIQYGKSQIPFKVIFAARKTMEIAVYPDASITIKAPDETNEKIIETRIIKRARWIIKQIEYFRQFQPRTPLRNYIGGETHFYLGRQYRLKILNRKNTNVKLKGSFFYLAVPDVKDRQYVKRLLGEWYKDHALSIFNRRLEICYKTAKTLKVVYPEIKLRSMSKRWGSCSKSGYILLNTDLVRASTYCIDYVIMHELCHLKEHTHNSKYYKLLSKYMPDWKRRKERLEKAVV